ncbi:hypothetical protein A2U01_0051236, partial [Trifolium medium]|nr:hypothetical protein [Trifolium medium]
RDADKAYAEQAAASAPPPPLPHQQQHQVPPQFPQQHQYSDYEMGMAATLYEQHRRMNCGLPYFSPPLMAAVQDYRAQIAIPSYNQQYPQRADLMWHFQR